jgi:hypothetical protein
VEPLFFRPFQAILRLFTLPEGSATFGPCQAKPGTQEGRTEVP